MCHFPNIEGDKPSLLSRLYKHIAQTGSVRGMKATAVPLALCRMPINAP
jgi:hypothetical protein